jgi:hypothetical protein
MIIFAILAVLYFLLVTIGTFIVYGSHDWFNYGLDRDTWWKVSILYPIDVLRLVWFFLVFVPALWIVQERKRHVK